MSEVYRMTREEAIQIIKSECYVFNPFNFDCPRMINTALDMAIEALEQELILDKIYADIQKLRGCSCGYSDGIIDDVEDIIDKYKAESEVKDVRLDGRGAVKD